MKWIEHETCGDEESQAGGSKVLNTVPVATAKNGWLLIERRRASSWTIEDETCVNVHRWIQSDKTLCRAMSRTHCLCRWTEMDAWYAALIPVLADLDEWTQAATADVEQHVKRSFENSKSEWCDWCFVVLNEHQSETRITCDISDQIPHVAGVRAVSTERMCSGVEEAQTWLGNCEWRQVKTALY